MPKIKTHKATIKRIRKTAGRKIKRRKAGQDHFNSRERGSERGNKRRDVNMSKSFQKTINQLTPYN